MNKHYIFPGKLAAFKEETVISTLLGSCVAVALYDPVAKVGGLNHYLLPDLQPGDAPSGRYGASAIPLLFDEMVRLGASMDRIQAKIYGGGNVIAVSILGEGIGRRNIELAESMLKAKGIRIVEKNVGGESGRTLKLNTATFEVIHTFSNEEAGGSAQVDVSGFKPLQTAKAVKVLIVDDSATVRTLFTNIFQKSGLEVVGAAADAYQARELIASKKPDVLTLDIEMPRMSGVMFLEKLMKFQPTPVVMVSSLGSTGEAAMRALELGAVEFVHKPSQFDPQVLKDLATTLVEKVRAAASVNVLKKLKEKPTPTLAQNVVSMDAARSRRKSQQLKVTVLGGNAGSAPALEKILSGLAVDTPPMVVSCSIITNFMDSFLQKMKGRTQVNLAVAKDGEWLRMGTVYFIPAGHHGKIVASTNGPQLKLEKGAPVSSQLPSSNVLFQSAAQAYQGGVYAVLLAGFGMDGVEGLTAIQGKGGMTVVQHPEEAQFPYGPQKAIEVGVVEEILNSDAIAKHLMHYRNQAV